MGMIGKLFGIMSRPTKTWQDIAEMSEGKFRLYLAYPVILALIPAFAWFYGTTQIGWSLGDREAIKFSTESASAIAPLFYLAHLFVIVVIGFFVHWMAATYGAESSIVKGVVLVGFCATPIFLFGLLGFFPTFWLDMIVGLAAVTYAVYLLYIGIPLVMRIPEERGFLFASAVVAVALVMIVVGMGATVMLWDMGFNPTFID
jgi:hypothetical protein